MPLPAGDPYSSLDVKHKTIQNALRVQVASHLNPRHALRQVQKRQGIYFCRGNKLGNYFNISNTKILQCSLLLGTRQKLKITSRIIRVPELLEF